MTYGIQHFIRHLAYRGQSRVVMRMNDAFAAEMGHLTPNEKIYKVGNTHFSNLRHNVTREPPKLQGIIIKFRVKCSVVLTANK